jgi:hypothetical protein
MKTIKTTLILLVTASTIFNAGCKKEKDSVPPVITISSGTDFTPANSVIPVGGKIHFGITASGVDANITNLVIKKIMPDGSMKVVLDSGMNSSGFHVNETFYQNVEDTARWTFQVMDKNRQFATTAMTLYKDPNSSWGGIFEFSRISMGYQGNTTVGQFLIPSTGKVLQADSASLDPSLIDIITYYFDDPDGPSPTFSSAGELGGGISAYYPVIDTWSVKNYTKWDISVDTDSIPTPAFNGCHNDSLLIVGYDDVWGKRKFKWADPGDIIPFMTSKGKKGMIKVITADHVASGKIEFSLKIQQ